MHDAHERHYAAEATGLDAAVLAPFSHEPLGGGSVAGYTTPDAGLVYVDTSRLTVATESGHVHADGTRVWRHPADPHVPALASLAFPDGAGALLSRLGFGALEDLALVAYRPGRRAVLRAQAGGRTVWLKAVRPSRTERIVTAHRALQAAQLPVPEVLGWSPDGLIVIAAAEGLPVMETDLDAAGVIDAVDALRSRLAVARLDQPARASLIDRLDWYTARLREALPDTPLVNAVAEEAARADTVITPPVTIHGDLHAGQLFLTADGTAVSGLIDVDTAGHGAAADDSAAFIGHALASMYASPPGPGAERMRALARAAHGRWGTQPGVRARLQVHLMGHALTAAPHDHDRAVRLLTAAAAASHPAGLEEVADRT